jgi:hypothetical protein
MAQIIATAYKKDKKRFPMRFPALTPKKEPRNTRGIVMLTTS